MKKAGLLLIAGWMMLIAGAQPQPAWTSADMYLALRKLNVLGSVLYVAAHPDDENTRLIAYLAKDKLYRTGYLSLTRGDGGQNLIGDEQGAELGLIRTQELLAARRIDGGEQFFSRAFDFGFSKSPEETFTKWDKEKILSDVVWMIRKFRPDVIITRFPTTGEGGHGHHTASAMLANEAFHAAADPKRFPEQLKYVQPWQAHRILFNSFSFGSANTIDDSQFRIDVGGYNPLLGKSYGEIAAESRSQHKSQGFGVAASRGESFESFRTTGGIPPVNDLMDGVELGWKKIKGGEAIEAAVSRLVSAFDLLHPEKSVEGLVQLYRQLSKLPAGYWKDQKQKEVQQLIQQCSGLFMDATSPEQFAVQTDSVRMNFLVNSRLGIPVVLEQVRTTGFDSSFSRMLERNRNLSFGRRMPVPAAMPVTQPYWLASKMKEGYFMVNDQQLIGQADADPAFLVQFRVKIYGEDFIFNRPLMYRFTDPVKGELYEPLVVLPPVEARFVQENLFAINDSAVRAQVHFSSNLADSVTYDLTIKHSPNWMADRDRFSYRTYRNGDNYASFSFRPGPKAGSEELTVAAKDKQGATYSSYRRSIHYDHIPYIVYYKESSAKLSRIELKTYNKRIGYIAGAGDKVPQALAQMGYEVTLLGDKELERNQLSQYDAIITGIRAYNTNEWLNKYYDALMNYIKEGGNLVVQYNTSSNIGPVRAKIGPYPFDISRTRVTDENARVTFVRPDHPVLNFPNRITQADFEGWVQERSIYHGASWDKNFEAILTMSDPGEKADEGSLLIAKYGKGYFTYTGLVFFRELPAGVAGAYRLLANIIALNREKGF